jgi:hypothetical protein
MTITLLHGDHTFASRQRLQQLRAAVGPETQIEWIEGKKTTPGQIASALVTQHLFAPDRLIIIEQLHAQPSKKKLAECVTALRAGAVEENSHTLVILWEAKSLTATQVTALKPTKTEVFTLPKQLFSWLSLVSPRTPKPNLLQQFHKVMEREPVELCLHMLIRQVRLMISAKAGEGGSPAVVRQAAGFTDKDLFAAHTRLFELDRNLKTGHNQLTLSAELDLWLLSL